MASKRTAMIRSAMNYNPGKKKTNTKTSRRDFISQALNRKATNGPRKLY